MGLGPGESLNGKNYSASKAREIVLAHPKAQLKHECSLLQEELASRLGVQSSGGDDVTAAYEKTLRGNSSPGICPDCSWTERSW